MNLDTSLFVRNLVTGTVSYLKEIDFDLTAKQKNTLESSLMSELKKDFELQRKTPTQIINTFLNENLKLKVTLTPNDFGEKARDQIIIWGISKAKNLDSK
ncbi:hypothetical protein OBA39_00815 [Acidimicrobiaceae bacterium]|nr:hypothetical protein [Acidimicrobiaceae bacterium]